MNKIRKDDDLKKKGLYYAKDLNSALNQFLNRLPHEIIVIDENSIIDNMDILINNLTNISNRIVIACDNGEKFKEELNKNKEFGKNMVFINKKDLSGFSKETDIYYKMRFLWLEKFFDIDQNNQINIFLYDLEKDLQEKWNFYANKLNKLSISIKINFNTPNLNKNEIILDHHATFFRSNTTNIVKKSEQKIVDIFYEAWEKSTYLTFVFNSPPQSEEDFLERILEFTEMGLLRIIIIDERIAEKSIEKEIKIRRKYLKLWQLLKLQQVYIISHLKNCSNEKAISNNINCKTNTLEIKVDKILINDEDISGKFHCLIVHKTILANPDFSEFFKIQNSNIEDWIESMKKHFPLVILDSGRGEVDIPKNAKFLPYSYLEDVLVENTSKYKLTKTILRLTRTIEGR